MSPARHSVVLRKGGEHSSARDQSALASNGVKGGKRKSGGSEGGKSGESS